MPVFKDVDVYIKPSGEGGGGGGWGCLIGAVVLFLGIMAVLNLLGFTTRDSFEYQTGVYRRCEIRSILFIIELERACTPWLPQGGTGRPDLRYPLLTGRR
jgi:hypothetical protein